MIDREAIAARLEASAASFDGVTTSTDGDARKWVAEDVTFAILTGAAIELRLDPPIVDAATRTPDTASSPRGPEWIRFSPRILDRHATDRLDAWFALARRRAATGPKRAG